MKQDLYTRPLPCEVLLQCRVIRVAWNGVVPHSIPASNVLYVNANEAPTINTLRLFYDTDKTGTPAEQGASLYKKNCTSCHGLERQGNLPTYPALKVVKKTDEQIETTLRQGLGIMPAFTQFSDKEMDALIAFLRSDLVTPKQHNTARGTRAIRH